MGQLTQYLSKWTVYVVCALLSPSSLLLFYENVSLMPSFFCFFFGQIVLIKRNSILCCPILSEIILVTNKLDSYFMVIQFFSLI